MLLQIHDEEPHHFDEDQHEEHLGDDHAEVEGGAEQVANQPGERAQHEAEERQPDAEDDEVLDRLEKPARSLVDHRVRRVPVHQLSGISTVTSNFE